MFRKLAAFAALAMFAGASNASVLYSFDGVFTIVNAQPGVDVEDDSRYAGWNIGDKFHLSFLWDPSSAKPYDITSNCWTGAIQGLTISTQYSVVIPYEFVECGHESTFFIAGIQQNVFGAAIPPGLLDDAGISFTSRTGTALNGLPLDLSDYDPVAIGFQWIVPYVSIGGTFTATSVPEPASIFLLCAGALLLVIRRRAVPTCS